MKNKLIIIFGFLILTSCLKTTQEIEKEQALSNLTEQSQKIASDTLIKTKSLEEQVNSLQGRFEEIQHKNANADFENDNISELRVIVTDQSKKIEELEKELNEQKKFIKNVTKSLAKISEAIGTK